MTVILTTSICLQLAEWQIRLESADFFMSQEGAPQLRHFISASDSEKDATIFCHGVSQELEKLMTVSTGESKCMPGFAGIKNELFWLKDCIDLDSCFLGKVLSFFFDARHNRLEMLGFSTANFKPRMNVPIIYLLANLGAKTDGIFLHAAGAVIDHKAFAILGIPEAGKSTSIAMIKHDFLLSDDMVMMRFKDDKPILHSTPLGPNTDGPGSAPLTTIFYPVKSDHFELRPLSKLKAIEQYYHAQTDYWDKVFKPHRRQHFEKVVKLFSQVKAYEMHFPIDYIDNEAIKQAVANSQGVV